MKKNYRNICLCRMYQTYASELSRLIKYVDRDDITDEIRAYKDAIIAIYGALLKKRKYSDNTDLMVQINGIVNDYIVVERQTIIEGSPQHFDISSIDFEFLIKEFTKNKKQNLIIKDLEELVKERIDIMLFSSPRRINYLIRYQEIINAYNIEQDRATIEKTFAELINLASQMDEEQQLYVRGGFSSDEELSLYDMLFYDNLSKQDIQKIKKVAINLLLKIKKIVELNHWADKQETKADVDNLIRDTLWEQLPECYDEVSISEYRRKIYEYVYMRYREVS